MSIELRSRTVRENYEIRPVSYHRRVRVFYDGTASRLDGGRIEIIGITIGKMYIGITAPNGKVNESSEGEQKRIQNLDARVLQALKELPPKVKRLMGI